MQGQVVALDMDSLTEEERQQLEPDRPFPCGVCGRKFIRATHLRRHMRIHTGEKPFACHICGRRYARGDYLRAHIHAHRRDKIHKCKHCGEVFHDLTRFADHCRIVHKDTDDEYGNPMPPPENSPPPAAITLESTFSMESGEEITVIPVTDNVTTFMNVQQSGPTEAVPITLVNVPEPSQESEVITHTLPTPSQTPITSPEFQLAQLQALAAHADPNVLLQNGQIPVPVPETANEITVLSQPKPPMSYVDPITQYMISNGNTNNSNMSPFPTPTSSPIVGSIFRHVR